MAIYLIGTDLTFGMHFTKQYLIEVMLNWRPALDALSETKMKGNAS